MRDLDELGQALEHFRDEREWRQFHTLKDLILSLNLEAAELLELCQWQSEAVLQARCQEPAFHQALEEECADVLMYLVLIARQNQIDLLAAAARKMRKNAERFPIASAHGNARKYGSEDDAAVSSP